MCGRGVGSTGNKANSAPLKLEIGLSLTIENENVPEAHIENILNFEGISKNFQLHELAKNNFDSLIPF